MKKRYLSNSRLYITEDINHDNVWFVRTDVDFIARLELKDEWEIYFYIYKFRTVKQTLKECLVLIEKEFVKFWNEKYNKEG